MLMKKSIGCVLIPSGLGGDTIKLNENMVDRRAESMVSPSGRCGSLGSFGLAYVTFLQE